MAHVTAECLQAQDLSKTEFVNITLPAVGRGHEDSLAEVVILSLHPSLSVYSHWKKGKHCLQFGVTISWGSMFL